jgi:hypothetical protein
MKKKPTGEFEIRREDPPDLERRIIDWSVRLSKLAELVKITKDSGWYVIGCWPGVGSASHYRKKLELAYPAWEFKSWSTTKPAEVKSKLYARRKE